MCDKISRRIFSEIASGRFPHTCAIEGGDEGARETSARSVAAALLCENKGESGACGACESCRKVQSGRHSDLTFVVSAEKKATSAEELRRVRSDAYMSPFEAERKVIVFHRANTLSTQGQNILLKILEEPPKDVNFILTCPSVKMLLPTVRSRCTVYSLGEIPPGELTDKMKIACPDIPSQTIGRAAAAGLRLENFDVRKDNVECLVWALSVCETFYTSGIFPYSMLPQKKEDTERLRMLLRALSLCALEVSRVKKGDKPCGILSAEALDFACRKFSAKAVFSHYELFLSLYERLLMNANYSVILSAIRTGI